MSKNDAESQATTESVDEDAGSPAEEAPSTAASIQADAEADQLSEEARAELDSARAALNPSERQRERVFGRLIAVTEAQTQERTSGGGKRSKVS